MDKSFILYLFLGLLAVDLSTCTLEEKVCLGTNKKLSHSGEASTRYEYYKFTYTNCTFIAGNLEITFLAEEDNYDLSFLSTIKEVTGYVLISNIHTDYLPLSSLRIIRGRQLFDTTGDDKYYSLYISRNFNPNSRNVGIKELHFTSLYEIMAGNVMIFNNQYLCYANTIDWTDILSGEGSSFEVHYDNDSSTASCGSCHPNCRTELKNENTNRLEISHHCWGHPTSSNHMCQNLTRRICSDQCYARCFGELPNQCCNPECAGGCTGPSRSECWACKNFKNGAECEPYCPRTKLYNPETYKYEPNPLAKYAYGTLCVNKCPEHLVIDSEACVRSCGAGRIANKENVCEDCDGPCPKKCNGVPDDSFLNAANIREFKDCTLVEGNIVILVSTFDGDVYNDIPPLHPANLSILSSIQAVTGYIKIQGEHPDFTSLSFLKNLTTINGRILDSYAASLHIYGSTLKSLDLTSLKTIEHGMVLVAKNNDLCYVQTVEWKTLIKTNDQRIKVDDNKDNATCFAEGLVCHSECSDDGCWGDGDDQCLRCSHFLLDGRCVERCDPEDGVFIQDGNTCARCHKECHGSCSGPGAKECTACKNYKDGPFCVDECPPSKYHDASNSCQPCHIYCNSGCTGPVNGIGPGACDDCLKVKMDAEGNVTMCLEPDTIDCEVGYYLGYHKILQTRMCDPCHELCAECQGSGLAMCTQCIYFSEDEHCVSNCSSQYYPDHTENTCRKCSERCSTCHGPTHSDCMTCKQFKIYYDVNIDNKKTKRFNCTDKCPPFAPYRKPEKNDAGEIVETVCSVDSSTAGVPLAPILIGTLVIVVVIGLFVMIVAFGCLKRARALESKERLAARMSGMCDESEITPLTPTSAKPDMAILRMIKESALRKGTMVGSGAFGTVYKGFWLPEGENIKIPVAIKVLQDGTSANQNRELLEEARVMASVNNRYCVPVVGICMTAQIMLVAPYMPLGCLLDYVRKNQENIGSKVLLDWCTQIAHGMAYLEERGIVHRDLAARNVLVQNPKRVRVTDFGLAKLLDYNEEEFHASGGKMPIKWLALECMQYRIFTHKSDVWSFGITMWELFTYGQRPYENIRARDIPELLEKGERLPQPAICTIDVYMIMIKCWMLDAHSRPCFKELAEEFAKMARDPGRYLVIQGDRLMRLPSHTYDKSAMFRNMSVTVDGPEEIVEAEDYLMPAADDIIGETSPPHRHHHHRSHHHTPNGKLDRVKEENGSGYDNDRSRQSSHENSMDHAIPLTNENAPIKYSSLEAAAAQRKQREQSPNRNSHKSRYSCDPCKIIAPIGPLGGVDELDFPSVPAPPTPIGKTTFDLSLKNEDVLDGGQLSKHLQPAVDEDDYLQPASTSHIPKYMDLVQDDLPSPVSYKGQFTPHDLPPPPPDPPGYNVRQTFAENPEYFDENCCAQDSNNDLHPLTDARALSSPAGATSAPSDYYNTTDMLSSNMNGNMSMARATAHLDTPRTNPTVKYVV